MHFYVIACIYWYFSRFSFFTLLISLSLSLSIAEHTAHKTQNSDEINTLAIEALNFLESRTEFWQQQSPARSGKRQESARARSSNVQPARYVLTGLEEIDRSECDRCRFFHFSTPRTYKNFFENSTNDTCSFGMLQFSRSSTSV